MIAPVEASAVMPPWMTITGSSSAITYTFHRLRSAISASTICAAMMYHAYFAEISITQLDRANAIRLRLGSLTMRSSIDGPSRFHVMCSSYHTPNHQTNANANSGDLVSEIVANTASGQVRKNSSVRNRARPPAARFG